MTGRESTIRTLVSRSDVAALLRMIGYHKRFGSWRRARSTVNAPAARVDAIGGLVEVLAADPDQGIVELLRTDVASDTHPAVRAKCAWALGTLRDDAAMPRLTELIADPDSSVRSAAATAIAAIPQAASGEAVDALVACGSAAGVAALAMKRDASKSKRNKDDIDAGLRLMAKSHPAAYVEAIDQLREAALRAPLGSEGRRRMHLVGLLGEPALRATAEMLLEKLAGDPHPMVVAGAVAGAGSPAAAATASAVASDGRVTPRSRRDALRMLDELGVSPSISICLEFLRTSDRLLVDEAERRLEQVGAEASGPLLGLVLDADVDLRARIAAMNCLPTADANVLSSLAELVLSDDRQLSRAAAGKLGQLEAVPASDSVRLGVWLAREETAAIIGWLGEQSDGVMTKDSSEGIEFLLERLDWLEEATAVDVAVRLLALGVSESDGSLQKLVARVRAMATKPDDTYQDVEAGDRDMYAVTKIVSHEEIRAEGRRLLAELSLTDHEQQLGFGDLGA